MVRLALNRLEELRTEEKVDVKGEAEVVLNDGLFDEPGLRAEYSDVAGTLVDKGVSPRRVLPGGPQAEDCRGLTDPALDELEAVEAIGF